MLKEMFRRYEFRALLGRVDELDAALPAANPTMKITGVEVAWREEPGLSDNLLQGVVGVACDEERLALATPDEVVVSPKPLRIDGEVVAHDAKALRVDPLDDTMIMAYLIDPGRASYELDDLTQEYGVELLPQPEPPDEETATLVKRAAATLRLREPLAERVRERGSEHLYREVELPLVGVLAAMEDVGVRIDTYRMGEITARLADRVEELEEQAHSLAGEEFMLGSTQQVARILFETLQLTPGRKGKTGYSTDTRVLRGLRNEHPIVPVLEEWREYSKLLNTYLQPLPALLGQDGRLHTTFNQTVAATGRLSTSNPNLQSIPIRTDLGREIRSAFVAEDGYRLIAADYSQIELRILAHVSGEPKLREAFENGDDIHRATAAEVLGRDPATLTTAERSIAKMINFGIIYGISAFGLSENLEIPRDEAQTYIDTYLARFPHVQDFIQRTIEQARVDGYVTSLLGRRRLVPEVRAQNRQVRGQGERFAVNFVMQGSNADIIKVAMVRIHERLRAEGRGARLVLQIHDELLLEVPEPEVSKVRELVREEMVRAYPLDPPLAVDAGVGDDWNEAKS
jgi:DNA polymerase-1